ncbi:MAG: hypothetical protein ABL897_12905 [Hyphomicrobium sp.]
MAIPPSSFSNMGQQLANETSGLVGNSGLIPDEFGSVALATEASTLYQLGKDPSGGNVVAAASSGFTLNQPRAAKNDSGGGESYRKASEARATAAAEKVAAAEAANAPTEQKATPFTGVYVGS